ncbi:hypothetical protein SAMN05421799_101281 [Alicyclobacillus vulcanalis]|uniref:Uncharacterized protein n=1 Tax=Alicyclobacillus vulcanalis TaxID=252246 RepID=A0A1N7K0G9_9BACL|nr:hypothetical protein SAMN05421799_101281 [Alicyclobacillus vulcanalis]
MTDQIRIHPFVLAFHDLFLLRSVIQHMFSEQFSSHFIHTFEHSMDDTVLSLAM